jgi:GNAT superfamily N-acetyltransferase
MAEIIVKEVQTQRELREFIYLPSKIHNDEPDWLPPIYNDEWLLFNKKKNRSYQYTDAVFYLAYKNNKPVGRIMGLVNNRYNAIKNEKHGRFCFMECYNDREIAHALLKQVEEWVVSKGMIKIVGPLGFSDKDPQGFQIEGFEYPFLFTAATNSPYLPEMMEAEGYTKEVDLVNYYIAMPDQLPPLYTKAYERFSRNSGFELIEFSSKKEIKPFIIPVLELMNQTFSEIYGFVPLNDAEKQEFADRYLPIIDPEFIKVVRTKNQLVGFFIALPDMTAGIIAARGKLFPFGIFKILREMKKTKKLMLMLGGVRKDYRGQGIDILLGMKMLNSARKNKMSLIVSHLILENNTRMRAECERLDGKIVKRFRIYQKQLKPENERKSQ